MVTAYQTTAHRDILIVKLGSTIPELAERYGDFEDWIIRGMGLTRKAVTVVDPTRGEPLPSPNHPAAVIVSGSHAMVTDHEAWSETTALWLHEVVKHNAPILGICYGHQLLAYAFGGEITDNPHGREYGTVRATLTENALNDPLLGAMGPQIWVQTSHTQSVLQLPEDAYLLAQSSRDPHLAFRIGENAWGVQFHPEFDVAATRAYIQRSCADLLSEGQHPQALLAACSPTPCGAQIMRQFAALATRARS